MNRAAWGDSPVSVLAGLEDAQPCSRIETSPFSGVIFVLLIIFMVITPALGGGYLPRARSASVIRDTLPSIAIDQNGRIYLDYQPVSDARLQPALATALADRPAADVVMLTADPYVAYHRIEFALNALQAAGIRRVVLEAEIPRSAQVLR